jgi:hypothetical protein
MYVAMKSIAAILALSLAEIVAHLSLCVCTSSGGLCQTRGQAGGGYQRELAQDSDIRRQLGAGACFRSVSDQVSDQFQISMLQISLRGSWRRCMLQISLKDSLAQVHASDQCKRQLGACACFRSVEEVLMCSCSVKGVPMPMPSVVSV